MSNEEANHSVEEEYALDPKWARNALGNNRQRTGKFSREESEIVRKAVEEYCAMKQVEVARLCSECDHKAELKGAWMKIAERLPHRSVQSVYRHGLRILHPFKRGAWSEDECQVLVALVTRMGKKWSSIQNKMHRSADSCRDKYREMSNEFVKGRWKESETEDLKKLIREYVQVNSNVDMKDLGKMVAAQGIVIPWSHISKRMGKRSRLSCFKKWQKMTGLYSPSDSFKKVTVTGLSKNEKATSGEKVKASESSSINVASTINNPISPSVDFDLYLLVEVASANATKASDVNWDGIRLENPNQRWIELLEEFQASGEMDEAMMAMPVSQVAQHMLDRKTSAQRAAETVEAVDLPLPETLHTREV